MRPRSVMLLGAVILLVGILFFSTNNAPEHIENGMNLEITAEPSLEPTSTPEPVLKWEFSSLVINDEGASITGDFGGVASEKIVLDAFWDMNGNYRYLVRTSTDQLEHSLNNYHSENDTSLDYLALNQYLSYGDEEFPYFGISEAGISVHPPNVGELFIRMTVPLDGTYTFSGVIVARYLDIDGFADVVVLSNRAVPFFSQQIQGSTGLGEAVFEDVKAGDSFYIIIDQGFLDSFEGDAILITGEIIHS